MRKLDLECIKGIVDDDMFLKAKFHFIWKAEWLSTCWSTPPNACDDWAWPGWSHESKPQSNLWNGAQEAKFFSHHLLQSRVHTSRKLNQEQSLEVDFYYEMQASYSQSQMPLNSSYKKQTWLRVRQPETYYITNKYTPCRRYWALNSGQAMSPLPVCVAFQRKTKLNKNRTIIQYKSTGEILETMEKHTVALHLHFRILWKSFQWRN